MFAERRIDYQQVNVAVLGHLPRGSGTKQNDPIRTRHREDAAHISIRRIGNSQGVVIPKPVLAQLGLDATAGVEMTIEDGALVLRRPASPARTGWAEAARRIAEAGDDELVMGEFGNAEDSELVW